ncbi:hypothetical protein [Pseudomonas indica]|uniref:hypothetical protein n=1 Tax=Pseudomonas indica TaxID=137658 RepID=UPI001140C27A|nr:hypothetical protein [Pseudomonas indica]
MDKNGVLGFNIRAQGDVSVNGSGRDMFISAMQRIESDGVAVKEIRGYWIKNSDSVNYAQYASSMEALGTEKAALNTWTGKIAQEYGFSKVEKISDSFGNITVIFGK